MSFARSEQDEAMCQSFGVDARDRNRDEDERRTAKASHLRSKDRERVLGISLCAQEESSFLGHGGST